MKMAGRALFVGLVALLAAPLAHAQDQGNKNQPPPETPPPEAVQKPVSEPLPSETPKTPTLDEEPVVAEPEVHWGIGARSYFVFVPTVLFNLFVEHSTPMTSVSFAGSVIRRKGNFDIQFTLEYGKFAPNDGLWQEKDEDPSMIGMYPDFDKFGSLGMVSVDASFIWHADLADFLQFRYGAGIGLGFKVGKATSRDQICDSSTEIDDLDNPSSGKCTDDPMRTAEEIDIPPVLPVINLVAGLRFKLVDQLSLNIETGFRFPAFFVGGGIGYFF